MIYFENGGALHKTVTLDPKILKGKGTIEFEDESKKYDVAIETIDVLGNTTLTDRKSTVVSTAVRILQTYAIETTTYTSEVRPFGSAVPLSLRLNYFPIVNGVLGPLQTWVARSNVASGVNVYMRPTVGRLKPATEYVTIAEVTDANGVKATFEHRTTKTLAETLPTVVKTVVPTLHTITVTATATSAYDRPVTVTAELYELVP